MQLNFILEKFGIDADQIDAFSEHFQLRKYTPRRRIFEEGEKSDVIYLVKTGELLVSKKDSSGESRSLAILSPGDLFGEVGVLQQVERTASVSTLTHVQLYELDKEHFDQLVASSRVFQAFLQNLHLYRALQNVPMFNKLDTAALEALADIAEITQPDEGETLVREGAPVKDLYLLLEGTLEATDGHSTVTLSTGDHLGEQGLLAASRYDRTVTAGSYARIARLNKTRFLDLVRRTPSIALKLPGLGFLKTLVPLFFDKSALLFVPDLAMNNPRKTIRTMLIFLGLILIPAILPNISAKTFPFLSPLTVDTNPENMLSRDEPVRVFHKQMRKRMDLHDMIVLGVVNDKHPQGVFNVQTLAKVHALTEFARGLQWPSEDAPRGYVGVISDDVLAPSTVDVIEQDSPGSIRFEWLMRDPPQDDAQALAVFENMKRFPMMADVLAAQSGRAIAIYLPITSKEISYRIYNALQEQIEPLRGDDEFYITGLPVAEDVFGVEMFIQMAVAAPAAMIVIFMLMLYFFRSLTLVYSPMIIAMVSVMSTMGLLIVSGNTVHIMSSMIAIFVMPIAVLDSVHILSEFFDKYPRIRDKRLTMNYVMRELFIPMMFTSITTAVGFASLSLVPIPPVQVFGVFVAIGVVLAWILSVTVIPAYVCLMSDQKLERMAAANKHSHENADRQKPLFRAFHIVSQRYSAIVVVLISAAAGLCLYGVSTIVVNDNPIRWFSPDHDIRIADEVLNEHLGGTYMAYLSMSPKLQSADEQRGSFVRALEARLEELLEDYPSSAGTNGEILVLAENGPAAVDRLRDELVAFAESRLDGAADSDLDYWEDVLAFCEGHENQPFKDPRMLEYISQIQSHMGQFETVGKTISLADFSKTVFRELKSGRDEDYVLPATAAGVAQTLLTYQNSHRPQDLWHSVTPDYGTSVIWFMLKSGDNRDMQKVVDRVDEFLAANPPPVAIDTDWFGLTYVNVIWQEKMVVGMLTSIGGSFLAVWFLMIMLLRSWLWGLLAMAPLTATMLIIYGVLGLAGKSYDMPVAVLSSLSIGLAVDFTIHFLVRIRHIMSQAGSPSQAIELMFGEPAVAIWRNMMVVAIGFLPLLLSPLVPYQTVGILIAIILSTSGIVTLLLLPSVLNLARKTLFPQKDLRRTTVVGPRDAIVAGVVAAALVGINLEAILDRPPGPLLWSVLLAGLPLLMYLKYRKP